MKTPLSSMLLVLVASLFGSFGAACLKSGAERLHFSFGALIRNYYLAAGVGLFIFSSYFFVLGVREGELSVTEVCFAVGCSSLGTFSTRFAELVGVPPSVYRVQAAGATVGIPQCMAKRATRPIRNREASTPERP